MKIIRNHSTPDIATNTQPQSIRDSSMGVGAGPFHLLRNIEAVQILGNLLNEVPVISHNARSDISAVDFESGDPHVVQKLNNIGESLHLPGSALSELLFQSRFGGFLIPEALVSLAKTARHNEESGQSVVGELEKLPVHYQNLLKSLSEESSLVAGTTALALVQLHSAVREGVANPAFSHQLTTFSQIAAGVEAVHSFVDFFTRMQGGRPAGFEPYVLNSLRTALTRPLVELSLFSAAQSAKALQDGYTPAASFYLSYFNNIPRGELCEVNAIVIELTEKYPVLGRLVEYYEKTGRETLSDDSVRVPQMLSASDAYKTAIWYRKSFEALTKQISQPNNRRIEKFEDCTILRITGGTDLYFSHSTETTDEVGIRVQFGRREYSPLISIVTSNDEGMTLQYTPLPPHVVATGLRATLLKQSELFSKYSDARAEIVKRECKSLHDKKQQLTACANRMTILPAVESEHNDQILRVLTALNEVGVVAGIHGTNPQDSATRSLIAPPWVSPADTSLDAMVEEVVKRYAQRIQTMTNE